MPDVLTARQVRQCLAGTRLPDDPLAIDVSDPGHRMPPDLVREMLPSLRPAGVLVPLIERRGALSVLLTERAADLRHHAGQVSFPGGGMEETDEDIAATALREAHEEVGIHPAEVDVAGFLRPTPTITGFAVTPVIGFVQPSFTLKLDPVEVDAAFEVPLDFLMDQGNEQYSEREHGGIVFRVVTFHFDGHRIWGATAGILTTLRTYLI
jgi:8-oxo-dGTP pyrophosphatase MutT (NUDIX family)